MTKYHLGGDVSKGYCDFVLCNQHKEVIEEVFQLDDTATGHQKLNTFLIHFLQTHEDAQIYAGLESTGGFENNWYRLLRTLGESLPVRVARLNPALVEADSRAGARRMKTDPISARVIAEYLISHPEKVRYNQPWYPQLRRHWNFIQLNLKQKTQLSNHLQALLYTSMPELVSYCREGIPHWLLVVLTEYASYDQLNEAGVAKLAGIRYVSREKAENLLHKIRPELGDSGPVSADIIATLARQMLSLKKDIQDQKKLLAQHYQTYGECPEEIELLCSFPGIAVWSAVGLMLNIGSVALFPTVKNLASQFGVHPVYKQSGDGSWGEHMSKQGRAEGRAVLYMVARSAIQCNPIIKQTYETFQNKGMTKTAALGVCMHKILRIVYGMLKNGTCFDARIDQRNKQKAKHAQPRPKQDKRRRWQRFDPKAPVSQRQYKKRQEQTRSQDEELVKCGIQRLAPTTQLLKKVIKDKPS